MIGSTPSREQVQTRLREALKKGKDSEKPSKRAPPPAPAPPPHAASTVPFFQLQLDWLDKEQKLKTQGLARWWSPSHKDEKAKREGTLEMRSRFHNQEEEKKEKGH